MQEEIITNEVCKHVNSGVIGDESSPKEQMKINTYNIDIECFEK